MTSDKIMTHSPKPRSSSSSLAGGRRARRWTAGACEADWQEVCSQDGPREYLRRALLLVQLTALQDTSATVHVQAGAAVGETVILLHPPLPLVAVSIAMERERQQNDSLADG